MKKAIFFFALLLAAFASNAQQYEYKVVTVVESIVPMGLGRSMIVENKQAVDAKTLTTTRVDGKHSNQKDIDRDDVKIENFDETKLLNFYSAVGINFQNIASNDAVITSKVETLVAEGWEIAFVVSAVESSCGQGDGAGIYITRFVFKRLKK